MTSLASSEEADADRVAMETLSNFFYELRVDAVGRLPLWVRSGPNEGVRRASALSQKRTYFSRFGGRGRSGDQRLSAALPGLAYLAPFDCQHSSADLFQNVDPTLCVFPDFSSRLIPLRLIWRLRG